MYSGSCSMHIRIKVDQETRNRRGKFLFERYLNSRRKDFEGALFLLSPSLWKKQDFFFDVLKGYIGLLPFVLAWGFSVYPFWQCLQYSWTIVSTFMAKQKDSSLKIIDKANNVTNAAKNHQSLKSPHLIVYVLVSIFQVIRCVAWIWHSLGFGQSNPYQFEFELNCDCFFSFTNGPCNGIGSGQGTCYTSQECSNRKGVKIGSCASGFGVCCRSKFNLFPRPNQINNAIIKRHGSGF